MATAARIPVVFALLAAVLFVAWVRASDGRTLLQSGSAHKLTTCSS